ncbi:MAG: cysteine desulfurase [Myxococcota bacterium]
MLECRADFPILHRSVHGKPLVYLDNAATSQKPRCVIDAISRFYEQDCANVHRGAHALGDAATAAYQQARERTARFIHARGADEIVFVRGATEGINLIAQTVGAARVRSGDEVVVSAMEHHANLVPWQVLCRQQGARLRIAPITDSGELDLERLRCLIGPRTRIVSLAHVSHVLGTVNPIATVAGWARAHGARVVVDGAQAVPHIPVDVQQLGCDFYAFSGHKMYGPMGIGVVHGHRELLQELPPYQTGGGMIAHVDTDRSTYASVPLRFEAGTPNVAGAVGLHAAMDYLDRLGRDRVAEHGRELLARARRELTEIDGLVKIGTARDKTGIVAFTLDGVHPHDVASILDLHGVAIRSGHLCAQPLMRRLGVAAVARASFGCYNTQQDVAAFVAALRQARRVFPCKTKSRVSIKNSS